MKLTKTILFITAVLSWIPTLSFAQRPKTEEEILDSLSWKSVDVPNPVYKPVVGLGIGVMNFYGEVRNTLQTPVTGPLAYKLNIATFLDKKHMFKTNFVIMKGTVTGNERSPYDTSRNKNFQSDIFTLGLNLQYDFGHFIKFDKRHFIRPFISIGIENVQFNSKTDLTYTDADNVERPYYYWNDGTIRNVAQNPYGIGNIVKRDYNYETDLRSLNRDGLGSYNQSTFAIPLDLGIDFKVSERVNLRLGYSLHYTFTDNIDDVSHKASGNYRKGDKWNDMFTFSYFSLHMDLFSDATERRVRDLAADVTGLIDQAYLEADEDNDLVPDYADQCPGTPFGVKVDSIGCPLDKDYDGVPDYLDKEQNTRRDALVDENGVEIKVDDYAARMNIEGINRKDVEGFLLMRRAQNRMKGRSSMPIPPKFKSVDTDGDGYISFDELVKSINDFFDSPSEGLTTKDIFELQDFFFEQ